MRMFAGWMVAVCFVSLFARSSVAADQGWTLTTDDFLHRPVELRGFLVEGLKVRFLTPATVPGSATDPSSTAASAPSTGSENDLTISYEQFLKVSRPTANSGGAGKWVALLVTGDRLCGEPISIHDDQLTFKTSAQGLDEMSIPMRLLTGIFKESARAGIATERAEDKVVLANGDSLSGIIAGMADGKVQMQTGGQTVPVGLDTVDMILFATTGGGKKSSDPSFRIELGDKSILTAARVVSKGTNLLELHLADGSTRTIHMESVMSIEQLNGPVAWLSTMTPVSQEQASFSAGMHWPARMDRTVTDQPIRIGANIIERGIGVHANSKIVFGLDGSYKGFSTRYAIDTGGGNSSLAAVNVRILLDEKVAYEKRDVRAGDVPPVIMIDVQNAKTLTLEATAAGPTDAQDRLTWIEPALLRHIPASP